MSSGNGTLNSLGAYSPGSVGTHIVVGEEGKGTLLLGGSSVINANGIKVGLASTGSGTFTMTGGQLNLGVGGIDKADGSAAINLGGGTIKSTGVWVSDANMNLTGTNGNVTFNTNGYAAAVTGVMSGSGGLNKTGDGSLILAANHTYTGDTLIQRGNVHLNAGCDIADQSAIKVASTASYEVDVASGAYLSNVDVRSQYTGSDSAGDLTAALLNPVNATSGSATVSMAWRASTAAERSSKLLASNVLTYSLSSSVGGYVLAMQYNESLLQGGTEAALAASGLINRYP